MLAVSPSPYHFKTGRRFYFAKVFPRAPVLATAPAGNRYGAIFHVSIFLIPCFAAISWILLISTGKSASVALNLVITSTRGSDFVITVHVDCYALSQNDYPIPICATADGVVYKLNVSAALLNVAPGRNDTSTHQLFFPTPSVPLDSQPENHQTLDLKFEVICTVEPG